MTLGFGWAFTARGENARPALRLSFGTEESTPLLFQGGVQRDQAGPRPPLFPAFAGNNTAIRLDGRGARVMVADPGPKSKFDFGNGDEITIESWVKLDRVRDQSPMYIIGKGRTGSPHFESDNQNWALRIVANQGVAKLSFLFATRTGVPQWHRWTSELGFRPSSGWHHVAVAYRFGTPGSVRGWIDGKSTAGVWDMGGPTRKAPVVDDDAVWIGSSRGGSPSNSFSGWLDEIAVYRTALTDKAVAHRARRKDAVGLVGPAPEVMPELGEIPSGRVLVTVSEGLPTFQRWPDLRDVQPQSRWLGDSFLLPRIPRRYDDWGIRSSWKAPVLLRIAGDVDLPPGEQKLLVRARGLSRLWVDGKVVARTTAMSGSPPDGEQPVTPLAAPPLPAHRVHGYHQQEVTVAAALDADEESPSGAKRRVVLEVIVGGQNHRTETGEICVARLTDQQEYVLLRTCDESIPLTDEAVEPALERIEQSLARLDDATRRDAASTQDDFWRRRHEHARRWTRHNPAPTVPAVQGETARHPIDAFIQAKIQRVKTASAQADPKTVKTFHQKVLPILREHCFRCHGEKDSGGLKLDSRAAVLKGGDSEAPAVTPGKPEQSELWLRVTESDEDVRMPPTGKLLAAGQLATLKQWIVDGAPWPAPPVDPRKVALTPIINDEAFLRRVYFDVIGLPPTQSEAEEFLRSTKPGRREKLIDQLLADPRTADHWMSFWLDMLAENPSLLNASLNSTGPFRWFLYDSLRDNKPLDRMVTELILLKGSPQEGGSAGFALAGENDAPFAAKGHIVASAFLGVELQCARCHDSPYHQTTQRDLFSLAAMFQRKPATVPKTSRVPAAFFEKKQRESLIKVTLKPDERVAAAWPFAETTGVADDERIDSLVHNPKDVRERLAALITAPHNRRFAPVVVNRVWKRLMGAGVVEPAHDWEGRKPSHPDLLGWLAHELIAHDYDLKHVLRWIHTSDAYQRQAAGKNLQASADDRYFASPDPRRLSAEQIVDAVHAATGAPMDVEELTFVHDGRRPVGKRQTLGTPTRAWMFATLNNERDRPSLSLPRARTVTDVLQAFGWTGSRQKPIHGRESDPNVLQPGTLANSLLTMRVTRASHQSRLAQLAVDATSPEELVETLFLRVLTRRPKPGEKSAFTEALADGFASRLAPTDQIEPPPEPPPLPQVDWFNHLRPRANEIQQEIERRVRRGPPADPRLAPAWREVYEDVVWSLINHREFVWSP